MAGLVDADKFAQCHGDAARLVGRDDLTADLLRYQLRRASTTILADLEQSLDDLAPKPTEASVLLLIACSPRHHPERYRSSVGNPAREHDADCRDALTVRADQTRAC